MTALRVAVDVVIFAVKAGRLRVLLIKRGAPPFLGRWAVPGGFLREGEDLAAAAQRELKAGRSDRQFGGASDPVLFLVGGTGPSGSVTSGADGNSLSISLGAQR